jgi:hypothetical protein
MGGHILRALHDIGEGLTQGGPAAWIALVLTGIVMWLVNDPLVTCSPVDTDCTPTVEMEKLVLDLVVVSGVTCLVAFFASGGEGGE